MTPVLRPQVKQPAEALVVVVAFPALPLTGTLVSATATVAARGLVAATAPLVADAPLVSGDGARVRISGGTDGEAYLVTVRATDDQGEVLEAEAEIHVTDLTFAAPDGTTPYVTVAQFVTRVGYEASIRLTDELATGRVDVARLGGALVDAQGIVDGYLAQRFAVPLTVVPPLVTTMVIDLAMERFHTGVVPDGVAAAGARAMKLLRDLADGRVTLPGTATTAATPSSPAPIFTSGPDRVFSRGSLDGF